MQRLVPLARALSLLPVLVVLAAVAVGDARSGGVSPTSRVATIASITTGDVRVVVRATKSGSGQAPVARVTATTFTRTGAGWHATGARRLAGPFFWNVVTGSHAVCRFEVSTAGSGPRFRPRAVVQLLLTPSIGCGSVTTLRLGS